MKYIVNLETIIPIQISQKNSGLIFWVIW